MEGGREWREESREQEEGEEGGVCSLLLSTDTEFSDNTINEAHLVQLNCCY